jgi:hypothetical protein
MNNQLGYTLQPYTGPASRCRCPECNHRTKTFSLYIDIQTGDTEPTRDMNIADMFIDGWVMG